jgi:hypothetical protein
MVVQLAYGRPAAPAEPVAPAEQEGPPEIVAAARQELEYPGDDTNEG